MIKIFSTACALFCVAATLLLCAQAIPSGGIQKRQYPTQSYLIAMAPSENISPEASTIAASLNGKVQLFPILLTIVYLQHRRSPHDNWKHVCWQMASGSPLYYCMDTEWIFLRFRSSNLKQHVIWLQLCRYPVFTRRMRSRAIQSSQYRILGCEWLYDHAK